MIIDVHGHTVAPPELYAYQVSLTGSRGMLGKTPFNLSDDRIAETLERHIAMLDGVGTDVQLISPRPYATMHSQKPDVIVHWFTEAVNDVIARQVTMYPQRLAGMAGLPQASGSAPETWLPELRRCVEELGFVGCLINPDPYEAAGESPPMGDPYWYPLYEEMVALDVAGLVHPGGCRSARESYSNHFITEESIAILSLMSSDVFERFPTLRLVFCHGGGSIPYQVGRWRALRWRQWRPSLDVRELEGRKTEVSDELREMESFDQSLRRLYFDTVLYNRESLELLFKIVGVKNCLFGTEMPGTGSSVDPGTGQWMDDLKPVIEGIEWLSDEDRAAIFERNVVRVFPRLEAHTAVGA